MIMRIKVFSAALAAALLLLSGISGPTRAAQDGPPWDDIPVKGTVTMVDVGADRCIPCRMMAPILAELKEAYRDKAAIVFVDVWKHPAAAQRFGIQVIPTQIFYDAQGKEAGRHQGFLAKENIVAVLEKLGVAPPAAAAP